MYFTDYFPHTIKEKPLIYTKEKHIYIINERIELNQSFLREKITEKRQ